MTLDLAQHAAWNLACTLKVVILLVELEEGYAVMPTDDYNGEPDRIVREYDVFAT